MYTQVYTSGQIGTPPPPASVGNARKASRAAQERVRTVPKKKGKGGRGINWTFAEKRAACYAVTATNQEYCDGRPLKERFALFNNAYRVEVRRMLEANEWVNQFGAVEDKTTPEKSILERCAPVMTDTVSCPIHSIVEQVLKIVRNIFTPQLDKLLDRQGKIRTGQQGPDVKELLRMVYFEKVLAKKACTTGKKAAKSKGAAAKASSSSSSGDDEDTESPAAKPGKDQAPDEQEEAVKLQDVKDLFHPDTAQDWAVHGPPHPSHRSTRMRVNARGDWWRGIQKQNICSWIQTAVFKK